MRKSELKPLESRPFKFKRPITQFFCPLCRSERAFTIGHRLSGFNYLQILFLTGLFSYLTRDWIAWRGLFSFFFFYLSFEFTRRYLFKKQIPCPHCGFDASWYKRDVKKAKTLVDEFWGRELASTPSAKDTEQPAQMDETSA